MSLDDTQKRPSNINEPTIDMGEVYDPYDDPTDACPMQPLVRNEQLDTATTPSSLERTHQVDNLSWDLWFLFAVMGASLAMPGMALMFLVNTQMKLPLSLLPAYGAICFVPYSLKPVYAVLTQMCLNSRRHDHSDMSNHSKSPHGQTHWLLPLLLLLQAAALLGTLWVSSVTGLFVAGLLRGISGAWPEFLLELELVHQVSCCDNNDKTRESSSSNNATTSAASMLQSQAATARNFGSWAGHVLATLSLLVGSSTSMDWAMAGWLLGMTAVLNVLGSAFAWHRLVEVPNQSETTSGDDSEAMLPMNDHGPGVGTIAVGDITDDEVPESVQSQFPSWSNYRGKAVVCVLQIAVIVMILQGPMTASSNAWLWYSAMSVIVLLFVGSILFVSLSNQPFTYRVGLFLILRNAMPTASYLLASYVYELFEAHPVVIQLLSVLDMGVMTLASWSYGQLFGTMGISKKDQKCNYLYQVMIGTTIVAAIVSLVCQLILTNMIPDVSSIVFQASVLFVVQSLGTVVGEWKFLPDVVLATIASSKLTASIASPNTPKDADTECAMASNRQVDSNAIDLKGVQYGSLISCIDFGGQLNAICVGLLVHALDISRENDWQNLDSLVVVGALSTGLSVGLILFLLRPELS